MIDIGRRPARGVPLVVVGAGGFGRETLDVVEAINRAGDRPRFELLGVVDDSPSLLFLERLADRGVAYLGMTADWLTERPAAHYLIGVGRPDVRRSLDELFSAAGLTPATVVHPSAGIGSMVALGPGSIVCAGAQISTNVWLGRHVHINPNATIGHDSVLEDFVSVNPNATISGECRLEAGSYVGSSAVVLQGLRIGRSSVIGAAACVLQDVPFGATVVGVPARRVDTADTDDEFRRWADGPSPYASSRSR